MKMTRQDFDALAGLIEPLDSPVLRQRYIDREIPRGETVKDIDVRYRWDLYWSVRRFLPDGFGEGLKDSHIETALRRIVSPLAPDAPA